MKRRIGILVYDGVQGLDVVGPVDAFAGANVLADNRGSRYDLRIIALQRGPVVSDAGLSFVADASLDSCGPLDTIIVPGGPGIRKNTALRKRFAGWLRERAGKTRRVAGVCTGTYALAEAGLLDGRAATTHWNFVADVAKRWPKIELDANAIYVKSERYYTSAGITAGIDLALAMIEEDLGNALALKVARHLVVYLKRPGGQLQYSEPLRLQELSTDAFSETISWMLQNLNGDLTVEALAERANMSVRHFARKFKARFRATPREFVESLRLDHARWLLSNESSSIDNLATAVGYASDDSFRRAFVRRFGSVPSDYRRRLGGR